MERTVKRIIVLVLAFAFGVTGTLYGQVSTVMPKMSADSAAAVQAGADSYVMSCWEGFDYSRFSHLDMDAEPEIRSNAERLENKLAAYFWVLRMASDSVAQMSVSKLMDSVAASCGSGEYPRGYDKVMEAAERYFYTPDSPYYSEKRLLLFLKHKIGRTDIDEVYKARSRYLATIVKRNSVGSKAENFLFHIVQSSSIDTTDSPGGVCLYDIVDIYKVRIVVYCDNGAEKQEIEEMKLISKPLMLVFYSADCKDCRKGIARLSHSSVLKKKVSSGQMGVLAVCLDRNDSSVSSGMPKEWMVAVDESGIVEKSLYSVRNTPSVYLLDAYGMVLLKDASISEALDFLLDKLE